MKRFISMLLVFALFTTGTVAFAEEDKGLLGKISDFLSGVADGAGDALEKTGGTLNKAGEAAGNVMSNAAQALSDLWSSAGDSAGNAWAWVRDYTSEQGGKMSRTTAKLLGDLQSWVNITGTNAQARLHGVFNAMARRIGMAGDAVAELWDAILKYAEERDINPVVLVKLAIAVMAKIYLGRLSKTANKMAEAEILADVNTIVGWFIDNQIVTQKAAERSLALLKEFLN